MKKVEFVALNDDYDLKLAAGMGFYDADGVTYFSLNKKLTKTLRPGTYNIGSTMDGSLFFSEKKVVTDQILKLSSDVENRLLKELDDFIAARPKYEQYNLIHKRGILLHGAPGNGKTSFIHSVVAFYTSLDNYVIYLEKGSISILPACLQIINNTAPDKNILVIIEDLDNLMAIEPYLLALFDGENQVNNITYLATTNYLDKLSPRLLRPGRFDTKIEMPAPTLEARTIYLEHKLLGEDKKFVKELADKTQGFSLAEVKEAFISVTCLNKKIDEIVEEIKYLRNT